MHERRLWAVVADGARARLLKNIGHSTDAAISEFQVDHPSLGEIMSDRAGRSFSSVGKRRAGMAPSSDPVRDNERKFVDNIMSMLEEYDSAGNIDALMLIAAPQTLGDLRRAISPQLQRKVILESNKDLTGLPEKALFEAVERLRVEQG